MSSGWPASRRRAASRSSSAARACRRGPRARPTRGCATPGSRYAAMRSVVGTVHQLLERRAHVERERLAQVHLERQRAARNLRPHFGAFGAGRDVGRHDPLVPRVALHREQRGPRDRTPGRALHVEHVVVRDLLAGEQRDDALVRVAQRRDERADFVEVGDRATARVGPCRRCASATRTSRTRPRPLRALRRSPAACRARRRRWPAARSPPRPSRRAAPRCGRRSRRS